MKFLFFSDVHGDLEQCEKLVRKAEQVDIVIAAGDFSLFRKGAEKPIAVLSEIDKPAILVHGNHESLEELTAACRNWPSAHILHGTSVTIDGIPFFGIGGATPVTPFVPWSVDIPEEEAAAILSACPDNSVLISHSPPVNCLDAISPGRHIGSKSVRDLIEKKHPRFVVCGHIHEQQNQKDLVDGITVFNAGPLGIIYEVD